MSLSRVSGSPRCFSSVFEHGKRHRSPGGAGSQVKSSQVKSIRHRYMYNCIGNPRDPSLAGPVNVRAPSFRRPPLSRAAGAGEALWEREGDVGFPILFGGGFLSDTYPDVFRCILHVSCMYFDVSYQDTSRYIKIHQDTFVSVTLA